MTKSARRARKKRMAQEAQQKKEVLRPGQPMDPLDLSGPETDREEEDDQEILFPARTREPEELVTPPRSAQEATDCDIVNMVKTLNGAIAAVSQDTARVQRAYQQLCAENIARDRALADLTPAMMAQWLGCRTRNHKVASSSPVTAVSSLGIGSLNHNWVPDMTRWLCN